MKKEILLCSNHHPFIFRYGYILLILILLFIFVCCSFKYQSFIKNITVMHLEGNVLKLVIKLDETKYVYNNTSIIIDNKSYNYEISNIEDELLVDNNYNNYQLIYIKVDLPKKYQITNYVLNAKLPKENKKIIKYLLDYFKNGV